MAEDIRCLIVDDDPMTRKILENFVEKTDGISCMGICKDAIEASNFLHKELIDVVFLDVEMPEMSGLDFIKTLNTNPSIVLVTSKEKYAVPAFDLNVTDYIMKPVDYPRFLKAVNKVTSSMEKTTKGSQVQDKIFVKADNQLVGIEVEDIVFVEAMADYVRIVTPQKRYTVYSSMKGLAAKLPPGNFMRVHRSYIVNLNRIDSIEDNTLVLGENMVPIGVTYHKTLMAKLNTL